MRRYQDARGRDWDVVVGRESFGALYALFVPAGETRAETRQALLQEDSKAKAQAAVEALSDEEMNALFERSEPKRL
ncbi:MAG: hypothetical protein R3314_08990 [Longimicrobiales bacterium]|nr:hypothetical protein [Longimicrobiales bacterium]